MRKSRWKQAAAETDKTTLLWALLAAASGLLLLWAATSDLLNPAWQAIVNNVGGLIIATAVLSSGWELAGRRAFTRELLAKTQLRSDVVRSGLQRVTDQYLEEVEWEDLIEPATKVDVVVAYANTWRNTHMARLHKVARRPGTRIRIFLPDPEDEQTMETLAGRFSTTPEELRSRIGQAIEDFSQLPVQGGGDVEILVRPGDAVFSCYRFDGRAVITLYSHGGKRRHSVPTFVVAQGELWDFVYKEIQAIKSQSRSVLS